MKPPIHLHAKSLIASPSLSPSLALSCFAEHTANTSPKSSSSLKCEFGDDPGEISIAVPLPRVCVNGSHAYSVQPPDPGSEKPAASLGLGLLQKSLPLSMSLQNLSQRAPADLPKGPVGDGRRWSFDKPGEEEKAAIAAALEQSGPMQGDEEDERLRQAAPPRAAEAESQGKKQRRNLFSHGRSESAGKGQSLSKDESEQAPAATEEKHKGWFGSKDSHSKPSLVVSPKLEPSTDPHPPPLPSSHHPPGPPVDPASPGSPLHHTNPFCHSQSTPPPISPCNPFFSLLQQNPFYDDMLTAQPLKPSLPPLPYLSSSRPPIAQLFPQASNSSSKPAPTHDNPAPEVSIAGTRKSEAVAKVEKRPLPPIPLSEKPSNPFMSAGGLEPDVEWDESFEAFAAGRLQSPEDPTADCKTQQNTPVDRPLERCNNKGALLPTADADQDTNVNDAPHRHQPCTEFGFEAHKVPGQATNTNTHHFDMFAQFLETIPEHTSFESNNVTLNTPPNSPKLAARTETNQANSTTNTNDLTDTNVHQAAHHASSGKLNSSSPDPGSSGLGSSAEEDFLSCVSSYSDKFSASSSEETEAPNFESNILGFEKSSESAVVRDFKPSESEDDVTDRSNDLSLVDAEQHTVIEHSDADETVDANVLEGSSARQSPVIAHQQPVITEGETRAEKLSELPSKSSMSLQADDENSEKDVGSLEDLSQSDKLSASFSKEAEVQNFESHTLSFEKPSVSAVVKDFKPSETEDNIPERSNNESLDDFSEVLKGSSADVMTSLTPDDEPRSTHPSLRIITSSPDVKHSLLDSLIRSTPLESRRSSLASRLFGDFLDTSHIAHSPSQGFDDALLHAQASDQSTSSFLQSLYVSADSQDYQTCESHPSSKCSSGSGPNETLHSANSTLCEEPSEIQTADGAPPGREEETNQTDPFEESLCGAGDKTATHEPSFTIGGDFSLDVPPEASADSYMSCNQRKLAERGVETQSAVLGDLFSKYPEAQNAALHRSHSEGALTPAFDELLKPSFGSDPGAIQQSSLAQPGPDFPSLTSFAPSLTPDSSSSPVALRSVPFLADASARSPPSAARAAAPKPMPQESQRPRAANQQTSPHPVKPLTTAMLAEEKRTEGRSVLATGLEKLKSTIHPGRSSQLSEQETDRKRSVTEGAGSYYHLNHSELVALLVQREAELERQKAEFERQRFLLAKREVELRKLKPQVRDLEDYIDTLLVRIMEQKPTLLQVRSKLK